MKSVTDGTNGSAAAAHDLKSLVGQVVAALADLAIDADLSISELDQMAKLAFVRAAARRATRKTGSINRSRVAAITGLSRLEVSALLETPSMANQARKRSPARRVMDAWAQDKEFRDSRNRARTLPLYGPRGSFERLVKMYAGDIPPRAMLDRLERLSFVTLLPGNASKPVRVRPSKPRALAVDNRLPRLLTLLAQCLSADSAAWVAETNVAVTDTARLAVIKNTIAERGTVFLSGLRDSFPVAPGRREGLTVFFGIANKPAVPPGQPAKTRKITKLPE